MWVPGAKSGGPLMLSCFPILPDCLRRWTNASLLPLEGRPTFRHSTCSWLMLREAHGSETGFKADWIWAGSLRVDGAVFLALEAFNLAVIAALVPEESRPLARQAFFKSSTEMDARGHEGSTGSGMTVQGGGGGALAWMARSSFLLAIFASSLACSNSIISLSRFSSNLLSCSSACHSVGTILSSCFFASSRRSFSTSA